MPAPGEQPGPEEATPGQRLAPWARPACGSDHRPPRRASGAVTHCILTTVLRPISRGTELTHHRELEERVQYYPARKYGG